MAHHHHTHAGWHACHDIAFRREIGRVVVDNDIVEHAHVAPALLRDVRQVEHQDAARVVDRQVVIDVCAVAVLDLDPGDIIFGNRIAHDDVARLAHVNPGV